MKIVNKWWIWAGAVVIVTMVAMFIYPPVFYLNDDVTMRSILSGAYTGAPDGHAVYMQYPLTGCLALFYRVCNFVPWFDVFLSGSIMVCMILLIRYIERPYIGFFIAITLYLPFLIYMHYTIVAAIVAATAVFLAAENKSPVWTIVLLLLAYMVRSQVALLALPFLAASVVWRIVTSASEARREEIIKSIRQCVIILVGIIICSLTNYCFYASDEWKSYEAYNDSRTLLYDYTNFLSTDSYAENYAMYGMTQEEYYILTSYNTMLDAEIDEVKMSQVAELVSDGLEDKDSVWERVKDTVRKYYLQIRYSDMPFNYLWIGMYLIPGLGFLFRKKWWQIGVLAVLGIGRSGIWMYLIRQGRFPERVSVSLYLLEIMLLLCMIIYMIKEWHFNRKRVQYGVILLGCVMILAAGEYQWENISAKVLERNHIQDEWNLLKEYCEKEPERLYLTDVFSVVEYADTLFSEDSGNIMLLGGWMSSGPLAQARFEGLGYEDGGQCLFYSDKASLIIKEDSDILWLEKYLQNRFGECKLKEVDRIVCRDGKCFVEYRVEPDEE